MSVLPWAEQRLLGAPEMGPDERAPTLPVLASNRALGQLQPGHKCLPSQTLGTSLTPSKSPLTVPLTLCQFPQMVRPLLCPLSSATLGSRLRCAPNLLGLGSIAALGSGLCLPPGQGQGRISVLLGLSSPLWWATLQQGAGPRGPKQGGCEGSNDEQVPSHCQAQCGHCALQAQWGFLCGQPGSA